MSKQENYGKRAPTIVCLSLLLLLAIACSATANAQARPHGITIVCFDKHHHKVVCPSKKPHHHKKHHHKKPKPQPKTEAPVAPSSTTTPAPTSPPAEQPKVEPEAPYTKLQTIGEMELKEERPACTYVESPHGDPVTVHFDAEFGTFANDGAGSPVSGDMSCDPYTAPSNLPEAFLAPGLSVDFIEVVVQDTVTGKFGFAFGIVEIVPQTSF